MASPTRTTRFAGPWTRRHGVLALLLAIASPGMVILTMGSCEGAPKRVSGAGSAGTPAVRTVVTRLDAPRRVLPEIRSEPMIRVRIAARTHESLIQSDERLSLVVPGDAPSVRRVKAPVRVSATPDGVMLRDASGLAFRLDPGDEGELRGALGQPITVDGVAQPDRLIVYVREDRDGFDLVSAVNVDDYVAGVATGELYAGWCETAYRVQCVCARSYALHERWRGLASGRHYDVESTTADQVFVGSNVRERARVAALETSGIVLASDGRLLRAYYSSTCGGRAASAPDTWPHRIGWAFNNASALQASVRDHACEGSPLYRWTATRSPGDLATRLAAYGAERNLPIKALRTLASITPETRNEVDRPVIYKVTDAQGKVYNLSAEDLRLACNTKAQGLPDLDRAQLVRSGDLTVTLTPDGSATIEGRGFGHGVGMCQFCAEAMGERGDDWRVILQRFYPGAEVVRGF